MTTMSAMLNQHLHWHQWCMDKQLSSTVQHVFLLPI